MIPPTPTGSGLSPLSSKRYDGPFPHAQLGEDALALLALDGEVSADVIAALADDLEARHGPQVLVIDDFHLTGLAGADTLSLLLEYRPAVLQLVLASRADRAFGSTGYAPTKS